MKLSKIPRSRYALLVAMSLVLAACDGKDEADGASAEADASAPAAPAAEAASADAPAAPAQAAVPTLADGPDVCFRQLAAHLGADTMVSEITSRFSPEGELQLCTADYQSPDDPRKLVGVRLDPATGTFSEPHPIELTVSGNAADFRLDDYLIPLSRVDAAALAGVMEAQKAELDGVLSSHAWTGVRLMPPGAFSDQHTLRLDMDGRIAANDIQHNGYASVSVDGKTITANHLLP